MAEGREKKTGVDGHAKVGCPKPGRSDSHDSIRSVMQANEIATFIKWTFFVKGSNKQEGEKDVIFWDIFLSNPKV